jgi:hypothetical protein
VCDKLTVYFTYGVKMPQGNRTKKEQREVREIISDSISANPEQTLDDLIEYVNSELGFKPAKATVLTILAGLGLSAKRVTRWEDE